MIEALLLIATLQATAAPHPTAPADIMATLTTPRALVQLSTLTGADYATDATAQDPDGLQQDADEQVPAAQARVPNEAATRFAAAVAGWTVSAHVFTQRTLDSARNATGAAIAAARTAGTRARPLISRTAASPVTHAALAALAVIATIVVVMRRRRHRQARADAGANVRAARELVRGGVDVGEVARRTGLPRDAAALLELRRPGVIAETRERHVARRTAPAPATVSPRPTEPAVLARSLEQRPRTAAAARRPAARPALELAPTRTGARHRFAIEGRTT